MFISDIVKGQIFTGKSIFLDLDVSVAKIEILRNIILDLRSRNAIVSGICRIQVPDYSVI